MAVDVPAVSRKAIAIPVLDHGGVVLVDHMASDLKVVGAARVSTGKSPAFASKGKRADRKLIGYLMTNGHGSPFEHSVFQFYVKAPIFVVREWQRHRMASYNEQSGRYGVFQSEFYVPDHVRVPDPEDRQSSIIGTRDIDLQGGSGNPTLWAIRSSADLAFNTYKTMIDGGVAREMARLVLPLNLYTSFWFTVNARSLMNFLALRNHPKAQWEIQQYARAIESIFEKRMPLTHAAFVQAGRIAP